ncbi:PREDICTED: uncharacterized protein LOC109482588 [Branchiostoma belcheri]|uniref:non-specific serine/threonine protein kinase n=1 Tax=Branchiostoma belcheri TaxID=7741 RepID=A0A6P5A3N7_BRABE|nr:PREDICTED: uncharacterized protein LOC109482588 [Branchiostoma belcheri]
MYFHTVHGTAITLSDDRRTATRGDGFCNGITFSAAPMELGEEISIEFVSTTSSWSGAMRFGVTTVDPGTLTQEDLPRYAVPDLTNKEGYWAKSMSDNLGEPGNLLTFHVDAEGNLKYSVNNDDKGVFLSGIPVNQSAPSPDLSSISLRKKKKGPEKKRPIQLWALLDVYGVTTAIKFVNTDDVPTEILARGPHAMKAFKQAASSGTKPVFRTRLMLVGQDRVGKTSLKKSLTGQTYDSGEISTDGIDTADACEINVQDATSWKVHGKQEGNTDTGKKGVLDGSFGVEEEYAQAVAQNIVKALVAERRKNREAVEPTKQAETPKSLAKNAHGAPSTDHDEQPTEADQVIEVYSKAPEPVENSLKDNDLLKDMPPRVVELVTGLLKEAEEHGLEHSPAQEATRPNIIMKIWDFAGQSVYYTTHQVFLTPRAVYTVAFNLCHDLDAKALTQVRRSEGSDDKAKIEWEESEMTNMDFLEFWVSSIHAHTADNKPRQRQNGHKSPPVFIVGTHRNSLDPDPDVCEKKTREIFAKIQKNMKGRPMEGHVVTPYYAVENGLEDDSEIAKLRQHIEEVAYGEPYMGEHMPIRWLKFEQFVAQEVENGVDSLSLEQVQESVKKFGIDSRDELIAMLGFYHDLGTIVYFGSQGAVDDTLQKTVIFRPQWLVDIFKRVITVKDIDDQWDRFSEAWARLDAEGVLEDALIDYMWRDVLEQKPLLLNLMDKFDLLCERLPPKKITADERADWVKSYYVPSRLRQKPHDMETVTDQPHFSFFMWFHGFLPDGLFHRVLTRAVRWAQECGGREPQLYHRTARFFLDEEHDYLLEMAPIRLSRIKVSVVRVMDLSDDAEDDDLGEAKLPPPDPQACAKVRHFVDATLADLQEMWMKRVKYSVTVLCPCGDQQEHFLSLDQCLGGKVVLCEKNKRVKTLQFRKNFPSETVTARPAAPMTTAPLQPGQLPPWVPEAARLLNSDRNPANWVELANGLGYTSQKTETFMKSADPASALLRDWLDGSGEAAMDHVIRTLENMNRDDVLQVIRGRRGAADAQPAIFISYQWDIQDRVRDLRDRLETAGYPCWMDIGQMGGGDALYEKIDQGMRASKVVIACLTTKYSVSQNCSKEINLANLLGKTIIPIMFQKIDWPPPGGMSLIFSPLLYIDMTSPGGGHGGAGIHSKLETKFQEVVERIQTTIRPVGTGKGGSMEPESPGKESDKQASSTSSPAKRPNSAARRPSSAVSQAQITKCGACVIL